MSKAVKFRAGVATLMWVALAASPLHAADVEGQWSIGLHAGVYKLVLTDHSDAWTPGGLLNGDIKYGLSSRFSLGVEGSSMRSYLADLSGTDGGAGGSFDNINGGPQERGTVVGLIGEYQLKKESSWAPHLDFGAGMYFWKWTDTNGNTLMSDNPSLDVPASGLTVPDTDKAGNPYELKDQELYLMAGLGLDYYASDIVSIGLGLKFRYLTHAFTDFTGDKDIVGSDTGQLDLPKGILEGLFGLTFHFGGKCPAMSATGSASATTGTLPMDVKFTGSATGGCPEYTYAWNFGDSTTSREASPSHTYTGTGTYNPSLTITDSKGNSAMASISSITVNCPPLSASATGNSAGGTAPFSVAFQGMADGGCPPFTYAWNFGDGGTSTEQAPGHDYVIQGTFVTKLTVTDSKGASAISAAVPITVSSPLVPVGEKSVVLQGVHFTSNRSTLLADSEGILDQVAEILLSRPEVNVEIGGHTDADGNDAYNMKLSDARANTVRTYLIKKGVPPERLTARGYGETQPIDTNGTPEGKARNRRVELKRM